MRPVYAPRGVQGDGKMRGARYKARGASPPEQPP
jgi:hypothetical protein